MRQLPTEQPNHKRGVHSALTVRSCGPRTSQKWKNWQGNRCAQQLCGRFYSPRHCYRLAVCPVPLVLSPEKHKVDGNSPDFQPFRAAKTRVWRYICSRSSPIRPHGAFEVCRKRSSVRLRHGLARMVARARAQFVKTSPRLNSPAGLEQCAS